MENDLSEISAEMLLNYLYPELEQEWTARCVGSFFRNYNQDCLDVNVDAAEVILSRDGFLGLLPQGLLTMDNELKGVDIAEQYERLKSRIHLLGELFLPFDSYVFHNKLLIEKNASELLEEKLEYILKEYFDFDIETEGSALVREAAVVLPFINVWRGNFHFICNLLAVLLKCEVKMSVGRYSDFDSTICWLPKIRYELLIPGLSPEEFRQKDGELQGLRDFIREWLIPFDVVCEIVIKDCTPSSSMSEKGLILDYNTGLEGKGEG